MNYTIGQVKKKHKLIFRPTYDPKFSRQKTKTKTKIIIPFIVLTCASR